MSEHRMQMPAPAQSEKLERSSGSGERDEMAVVKHLLSGADVTLTKVLERDLEAYSTINEAVDHARACVRSAVEEIEPAADHLRRSTPDGEGEPDMPDEIRGTPWRWRVCVNCHYAYWALDYDHEVCNDCGSPRVTDYVPSGQKE